MSFNKARSGSSNADDFGINLARYVTIPTNEQSSCLFVGGASFTMASTFVFYLLSCCKPSVVSISVEFHRLFLDLTFFKIKVDAGRLTYLTRVTVLNHAHVRFFHES